MPARTIELNDSLIASMAAGGKIVVRDTSSGDLEVLTPPRGRIAYDRSVGRSGGQLTFGSLTKATLIIRGAGGQLGPIFKGVTGVNA